MKQESEETLCNIFLHFANKRFCHIAPLPSGTTSCPLPVETKQDRTHTADHTMEGTGEQKGSSKKGDGDEGSRIRKGRAIYNGGFLVALNIFQAACIPLTLVSPLPLISLPPPLLRLLPSASPLRSFQPLRSKNTHRRTHTHTHIPKRGAIKTPRRKGFVGYPSLLGRPLTPRVLQRKSKRSRNTSHINPDTGQAKKERTNHVT